MSTDIITGKPTVSQSEVDTFLKCDRAHYYGYGLKVQLRTQSDPLTRGTIGHQALEIYFCVLMEGFSVEDAKTAVTNFMVKQFTEHPEHSVLLNEIIQTLSYFYQADPFAGWKVIAVEQEYVLPITTELSFPFIVDLVIQDLYGYIWIIDHKWVFDFISDDDAALMPQLVKYMGAMRALGYRVDKIGFNQLRHRNQKVMNTDTKHRITEVIYTETGMKQMFVEQQITADKIQQIKKMPLAEWSAKAMRSAGKYTCKNCFWRTLCIAELNDQSPQLVLDSEYMAKTRREFTAEIKMIESE
jgi:hypothetical protein